MNQNSREIQDAVRKLVGIDIFQATKLFMGTVTSVDEDDRQCAVDSTLDGEEISYSAVNLSPERNDGWIEIPAVDSTVFCALMPDGESYVIRCSDITKLICYIDATNKFEFTSTDFKWNGGTFGGLIKIDDLKSQWDANVTAIKTAVAAALAIIDTQLIALGQAGGSATAFNTAAANILNMVKVTMEDTKIKH